MGLTERLEQFGRPALMGLTVVAFALCWPVGLGMLVFLIGSKRMVVYDDVQSVEKVKIYDHGVAELSSEELRRSYRSGEIRSPHIAVTEALQLEMRHFIECVREGRRPRSDGEAGLRVVRVLEAGMRSLRAGGARVAYRPEPATAAARA